MSTASRHHADRGTLTRDVFRPHTVIVLDADERPVGEKKVIGRCQRCARSHYARSAQTVFWEVVSPVGIEHIGKSYGMTECGVDAAGPDWWWAL